HPGQLLDFHLAGVGRDGHAGNAAAAAPGLARGMVGLRRHQRAAVDNAATFGQVTQRVPVASTKPAAAGCSESTETCDRAAATSLALSRNRVAAIFSALPPIAVLRLASAPMPAGVSPVSPCTTTISSAAICRISLTICA